MWLPFFTSLSNQNTAQDPDNPSGTASGTYTESTFTYSSSIDSFPSLEGKYSYDTGFTQTPLIFLGHGWGGNMDDMTQADLRRWAERGYFAVSLQLRGRPATTNRDASARELHDIYDAITYLKANFTQITDKHTWIGYSGGGGNGIGLASKFPDLFNVVVSFFGMCDYGYDPTDGWYYTNPFYSSSISSSIGGAPTSLPNEYRSRYHRESVYNNFSGGHIMIYHDPSDTLVSVVHSRNLRDSFINNSKSNYTYDEDAAYAHGNPSQVSGLVNVEPAINANILDKPKWTVTGSGALIVNGYIITKLFSVWFGDGVTESDNGTNRTATVVYNTSSDSYTVTPHFETGATQMRVIIAQGSKSANQIITTETVIIVT